jgi:alkylation response protein AidB-like acyl-CoA dehydrogenase
MSTRGLSPELLAFQERVRTFAARHVAPMAADIDARAQYPDAIHRLMVEQGLLRTVALPPSDDPMRFVRRALLIEELAFASAAVSMIPMVNELGCTPIQLFGTPEQKAQWLGGVAQGTLSAACALTEPQAGSDAAAITSTARREGAHWIIDGTKAWVCNVRRPGLCVVFARTGAAGSREAISAFVAATDTDGFEVTGTEPTLGLRGSPSTSLRLTGVRVPESHLLGRPGDGMRIAMATLNHTRPAAAAQALGIARAAFEAALDHARTRTAFGQPLIEHQSVAFTLADMHMRIQASRHLVHEANLRLGETPGGDPIASSSAKCFASDTAMQVATDAVQIFGGDGCSRNHPVERFFRDAKVTQILQGTNQIQRMVIARRLAAIRGDGRAVRASPRPESR